MGQIHSGMSGAIRLAQGERVRNSHYKYVLSMKIVKHYSRKLVIKKCDNYIW